MKLQDFHDFQKEIRNKRMPDSEELSSLAQGVVTFHGDLFQEFDSTLQRLNNLEKDLYKKFEKECSVQIFKRAVESNLIELPEDTSAEKITAHFDKYYSVYSDLFFSVLQSQKSRSENTFEHQFDFLFQKLNVPHELKKSGNKGFVYFLPNEDDIVTAGNQGFVFIITKNLRDQWRKHLNLTERKNNLKTILITLDERITANNLWQIGSNGFIVATSDELKKKKYASQSMVISFSDLMALLKERFTEPV